MEKIKVCAYCRVSTSNRDQENSFENQKTYFEREINANENQELIEIYADKGITGTSLNKREEFHRMLSDAGLDIVSNSRKDETTGKMKKEYTYYVSDREPLFNLILTKNTSRLARNILVVELIRKLKQKGVYIHFLDINKSTENDADEMLIQFLLSIDERDSVDKSQKIRFGIQEEIRQGKVRTNGLLYGYNYNKEERQLEINEEEAKNVRTIFELYASGIGTRRICNEIYEMGIRTKKGHRFNVSSIRVILKNQWYIGRMIRNRWDNGTIFNKKGRGQEKPQEEWVITENAAPKIISDELFYKCQEIGSKRFKECGQWGKKGTYIGKTPYAGKIQCGNCGNNYNGSGNKNPYYSCRLRKREGMEVCNNPNLEIAVLDQQIENYCNGGYLDYIKETKQYYFLLLDDIKFKIIDMLNARDYEMADGIKKELEENEKKIERLIEAYTDNIITKEQLEKRKATIDIDIAKNIDDIKKLTISNDEIRDEIIRVDELKNKINEFIVKKIFTKEELIDEIEKIVVVNFSNFDEVIDESLIFEIPKRKDRYILDFYWKTKCEIDNLAKKYIEKCVSNHMIYDTLYTYLKSLKF